MRREEGILREDFLETSPDVRLRAQLKVGGIPETLSGQESPSVSSLAEDHRHEDLLFPVPSSCGGAFGREEP